MIAPFVVGVVCVVCCFCLLFLVVVWLSFVVGPTSWSKGHCLTSLAQKAQSSKRACMQMLDIRTS